MADVPTNEDAALRYVLGGFSDAEQREFESRLATSAELRALVSELEAGVVAMATAAPRRRPPAEVWRRIEKTVAKKAPLKPGWPPLGFGWLRNGWAVAVICLIGWMFYAFSVNRHLASAPDKPQISQPEIAVVTSNESPHKVVAIKTAVSSATNDALELLQARTREILELRGKIAQLETAKTQLSRSLAWQQELLSESNRIKFYHLSPASTASANAGTAPLSPGLQRAVFMALARELGWLPATPPAGAQAGGNVPPTSTTIGGVDFIDLRPGGQSVVSQPQPQTGSGQPTADNNAMANTASVQSQARSQTESPAVSQGTTASDPAIPAYVSGDNLVVAMDQSLVPAGSSVTLTVLDGNQNAAGGSFILGNNPAVLTIPLSDLSNPSMSPYVVAGLGGWMVNINSIFPNGQTGTMQFFAPATNP